MPKPKILLIALILALGGATALLGSAQGAGVQHDGRCSDTNGKVAAIESDGARGEAISLFRPGGRTHPIFSSHGDGILGFAFSCDGGQIVYSYDNEADCTHLGVVDVATGRSRLYPFPGGRTTEFPTRDLCAADARFLDDGTILFTATGVSPGTYVVRPDGSHLHRLFRGAQQAASADGRWFVSTDPRGNFHSLYLLDSTGRRVRRLTGPPALHGSEYLDPSFSPDGRWIAYEEDVYSPQPHYRHHYVIYLVRRSGGRPRQLDLGGGDAAYPSFSPDGRRLLFTKTKGEGPAGNVYAMRLDDQTVIRKLGLSYGYQDPQWSPR